jgi:hypothetical protein
MDVYPKKKILASAFMLSSLILAIASVLPLITQTSIVGIVYAQGNIPVSGATVTVTGSNASGVATTDSEGKYAIAAGLGTGTCSIAVNAYGYVDAMVSNVQVTAGSTTSAPSIVMEQSGVISGVIISLVFPPTPPPPG